MLIALVAFSIGLALGWLSLRSIGWMIVLVSVSVGSAATTFTVNYTGSVAGTVYGKGSCNTASWVSVENFSSSGSGSYTFNCNAAWNTCEIGIGASGCSGGVIDLGSSWAGACGQTFTVNGTTCTASGGTNGPTSYYAGNCITNNAFLALIFSVSFAPVSGTAINTQTSGPVLPGEAWCWSVTNSAAFMYWFEEKVYDGEGNFVGQTNAGPFWGNTNQVGTTTGGPTTISPGSPPPGGGSPNDPGGEPGQTSNTNLTGGQFVAGITNLQNTLYWGFQMLSGNIVGALTNGGGGGGSGGNATNMSGSLSGIAIQMTNATASLGHMGTNSDLDTNLLSQIVTNTGGYTTSNLWDAITGGGLAGMSNGEWSASQVSSNAWFSNEVGAASSVMFGTNTAAIQTGDYGPWSGIQGLYWGTGSTADPAGGGLPGHLQVDLTPANVTMPNGNVMWHYLNWLYICFTWLICVYAIRFIRGRFVETLEVLGMVPGGGPGRSETSFLTWASGKAAFAAVTLALPILLGAIITTIVGGAPANWGGAAGGPLSNTAVNQGAEWAPAIRVGIDIVRAAFPLAYFLSTVAYLWISDVALVGFMVNWMRMIRATGN